MLHFFVLVLATSPIIAGVPHGLPKDPKQVNSQDLDFIGTVGGHTFFSNSLKARTWFEAKEYCESYHMHLASMTTQDEATLLLTNHDKFVGNFWIGAHDAQNIHQFQWDNVGSEVNYIPLGHVDDKFQTCLYFAKTPDHNHYHSAQCTSKQYTLCEQIGSH